MRCGRLGGLWRTQSACGSRLTWVGEVGLPAMYLLSLMTGMVAGTSGGWGESVGGSVALPLWVVAEELSILLDGSDDNYDNDLDLDVDMGSSPLAAREERRLGGSRGGAPRIGESSVVLFPAVPVLPAAGGHPVCEGTIPDSVDDDSEFGDDPRDAGGPRDDDPACGGGSRAGGYGCSCEAELGHLNGKFRQLEDMVPSYWQGLGLLGGRRPGGWRTWGGR